MDDPNPPGSFQSRSSNLLDVRKLRPMANSFWSLVYYYHQAWSLLKEEFVLMPSVCPGVLQNIITNNIITLLSLL